MPNDQCDGNQCCPGFDVSVVCVVCGVLARLALLSLFSFPRLTSHLSLFSFLRLFISVSLLLFSLLLCGVLCCAVLLCVAVCGCVCVCVCWVREREEGDRVYVQNAPRVYIQNVHVVPAPRPRVSYMWTWYHGDVLKVHTGFFQRATPHNNNTHSNTGNPKAGELCLIRAYFRGDTKRY